MTDILAAALAIVLATPLASLLHTLIFNRKPLKKPEVKLHPRLRSDELEPYQGPATVARRALTDHGIPVERVRALRLYRGSSSGLEANAPQVLELAIELGRQGALRGFMVHCAIGGQELPADQCLWFAQVANAAGDQIVCFVGPQSGISDYA